MSEKTWNFCPICGLKWELDSESFGCWNCGFIRSKVNEKLKEIESIALKGDRKIKPKNGAKIDIPKILKDNDQNLKL